MGIREKVTGIKDMYKVVIIYFIVTIISMVVASLVIKNEFSQEELKNYIWILLSSSSLLLILAKIFKVEKRTVIIFIIAIGILLFFTWVNREVFFEFGVTPTEQNWLLSILGLIGYVTTLPFQSVIYISNAYNVIELAPVVIVLYVVIIIVMESLMNKEKN